MTLELTDSFSPEQDLLFHVFYSEASEADYGTIRRFFKDLKYSDIASGIKKEIYRCFNDWLNEIQIQEAALPEALENFLYEELYDQYLMPAEYLECRLLAIIGNIANMKSLLKPSSQRSSFFIPEKPISEQQIQYEIALNSLSILKLTYAVKDAVNLMRGFCCLFNMEMNFTYDGRLPDKKQMLHHSVVTIDNVQWTGQLHERLKKLLSCEGRLTSPEEILPHWACHLFKDKGLSRTQAIRLYDAYDFQAGEIRSDHLEDIDEALIPQVEILFVGLSRLMDYQRQWEPRSEAKRSREEDEENPEYQDLKKKRRFL
jgi:hypothetical protein